MASDTTIVEVPQRPRGRLPFLRPACPPRERPSGELGGGAEALVSYVPASTEACEPVRTRSRKPGPGALRLIGKDMTEYDHARLQDTILGVDLREQDRRMVSEAGTAFLSSTTWKIAYASLKLPASTPHPGSATMRHAGDNLRKVAERVLANRRQGLGDGADLLARLVTTGSRNRRQDVRSL